MANSKIDGMSYRQEMLKYNLYNNNEPYLPDGEVTFDIESAADGDCEQWLSPTAKSLS